MLLGLLEFNALKTTEIRKEWQSSLFKLWRWPDLVENKR